MKAGKSIELTVNGFNSSKKYNTYEVDFPLKFGGKVYNLEAVVLPDVSTRFAADGIGSLAAWFVSKGYTLADPALIHYRNIVEDLDVVLGVDAAGLFMGKVVFYGENMQSQYLDTPGGVMPIGHSLTGYSNLRFLPTKKAKTNTPVTPNLLLNKTPHPPKPNLTNPPPLKPNNINPPQSKPKSTNPPSPKPKLTNPPPPKPKLISPPSPKLKSTNQSPIEPPQN